MNAQMEKIKRAFGVRAPCDCSAFSEGALRMRAQERPLGSTVQHPFERAAMKPRMKCMSVGFDANLCGEESLAP